MPLGHAGVAVAELRCDDPHWHAAHSECAGISMTQNMEGRRRGDFGPGARGIQRPLLMRWSPGLAVIADEDRVTSAVACGERGKKRLALIS